MTQVSASGFGASLANSPLNRPFFANKIISQGWRTDPIGEITNNQIIAPIQYPGQSIEWIVTGSIGRWRSYEMNQELIPDTVAVESNVIRVCHSAYKVIKIDFLEKLLVRSVAWETIEDSFLKDSWRSLSQQFSEFLFNTMVLETASTNKGPNAGKPGKYNLGTEEQPIAINPTNVFNEFVNLISVLKSKGTWEPGKMFAIVPPELDTILMNEDSKLMNCLCFAGNQNPIITGEISSNLLGLKVYSSENVPHIVDDDGNFIYSIIVGNKDATCFAGNLIHGDIVNPSHYLAAEYRMLAGYGGGVVNPEGLAIGYWTFK